MKTALDQHQLGIYDVPRYTISLIKEAASTFHANLDASFRKTSTDTSKTSAKTKIANIFMLSFSIQNMCPSG